MVATNIDWHILLTVFINAILSLRISPHTYHAVAKTAAQGCGEIHLSELSL